MKCLSKWVKKQMIKHRHNFHLRLSNYVFLNRHDAHEWLIHMFDYDAHECLIHMFDYDAHECLIHMFDLYKLLKY